MKLGALSFDLPDYGHDGLVLARNVYPSAGGYKPFKALSALTGSLGAAWVGGGAFSYAGTNVMLGATAAVLRSHSGGTWTTRLTVATTRPWFFTQFGDLVIATHGGAPVKYTISTATAASLGGSPPSASYCTVADDFVVLAGNNSADQTVYWSAIDNAEGWTIGTNLCDSQLIPDGGAITGIIGGNKYFLAFQRSAIHIFERSGDPSIVFSRRELSKSVGCIAHGSIARAGDMFFFLSAGGFKLLAGGEVVNIGEEAVDNEFLNNYTQSEIDSGIRVAVDERNKLVIWTMPGRVFFYHWPTKQWSDAVISGLVGVGAGVTASATLEQIAVTFPSIEDVTPNLDDAYWAGGAPLLVYFKTDFIGYTSSGANLEATFKQAKNELYPGRWADIYNAHLDTDATSGVTIHLDCSPRLGDAQTRFSTSDLRANGDLPLLASGRYIQPSIIVSAGASWTYMLGIDLEASPGGRL
jgi:hypothetical protein